MSKHERGSAAPHFACGKPPPEVPARTFDRSYWRKWVCTSKTNSSPPSVSVGGVGLDRRFLGHPQPTARAAVPAGLLLGAAGVEDEQHRGGGHGRAQEDPVGSCPAGGPGGRSGPGPAVRLPGSTGGWGGGTYSSFEIGPSSIGSWSSGTGRSGSIGLREGGLGEVDWMYVLEAETTLDAEVSERGAVAVR